MYSASRFRWGVSTISIQDMYSNLDILSFQYGNFQQLNGISVIALVNFLPRLRPWDAKLTKVGRPTNALAQWCTSWCHQVRVCLRNSGIKQGNLVPLRWCGSWGSSPALGTARRVCSTLFFGGAGSQNHDTLDMKWPLLSLYCGSYSINR